MTLHNFRQPIGQPAHKRVSGDLGLVLRRSPSPKRKYSAATTTPLESPHPLLSRDANYFPSRPPSANIPSPIPESPVSPFPSPRLFPPGSKNSKQPSTFDTSTPLPTAYQGGRNFMTPRRSLTTSSAQGPNSLHQRQFPFRYNGILSYLAIGVTRDIFDNNQDTFNFQFPHMSSKIPSKSSTSGPALPSCKIPSKLANGVGISQLVHMIGFVRIDQGIQPPPPFSLQRN